MPVMRDGAKDGVDADGAGSGAGGEVGDERALVDRWRDILALHARTQCELDRALHVHGLGASDFEVLDVLADSAAPHTPGGDCSFRVQEIADRVHLSQSALSRLIARLERDGLVRRAMCVEDRRGVRVVLTDDGHALHGAVLPVQRAVLARMLTAGQA
ncbi:MarR family transcriptional regulator [Streptomyces sp. NPDC048290]|uniref:MarR family winged helix-turn-helix transcriptional regulator n=1 Tax=Streptomyces sp. NPDC048290 TaxID=3155811 RepID=UPI003431C84C